MKRIISYTICGIVLATTLNSCHIYKKYERPEVDVQGLFRDTVSVTDTLAADSLNIGNLPWTEIFTDPILQGLIRQGLENNSDLQSAMLQVEAAQASFRAAQLAFLPVTQSGSTRRCKQLRRKQSDLDIQRACYRQLGNRHLRPCTQLET